MHEYPKTTTEKDNKKIHVHYQQSNKTRQVIALSNHCFNLLPKRALMQSLLDLLTSQNACFAKCNFIRCMYNANNFVNKAAT